MKLIFFKYSNCDIRKFTTAQGPMIQQNTLLDDFRPFFFTFPFKTIFVKYMLTSYTQNKEIEIAHLL
jgi:hypothetical protein